MFDIGILFDKTNLVFMHEAINVGALVNEPGPQELSLARLQSHQQVEDGHDQIVSFVWARVLSAAYCRHHLGHHPVDCNQFQHWTGDISDVFELLEHPPEETFGCLFVTFLRRLFHHSQLLALKQGLEVHTDLFTRAFWNQCHRLILLCLTLLLFFLLDPVDRLAYRYGVNFEELLEASSVLLPNLTRGKDDTLKLQPL